MGGKVLRCAGAALLAGLFLAATTSRGQATAADPSGPSDPSANAFTYATELIPDRDSGDLAVLFSEAPPADENSEPKPQKPIPLDAQTVELPLDLPYQPITGRQRVGWVIQSALWPQRMFAGVITGAGGTGLDRPREDGTHWGGFAERFGVRLTGVATSNVAEAGFGALWGEDPRYFPVPEYSFGGRVRNVIKMTFLGRRPDGHFGPAYARFIAIPGTNFLTNAWRPDSESNITDALLRTAEGFTGHMLSNAWLEFWPQTKAYLFHRHDREP